MKTLIVKNKKSPASKSATGETSNDSPTQNRFCKRPHYVHIYYGNVHGGRKSYIQIRQVKQVVENKQALQ
jgi:hypothetical protein